MTPQQVEIIERLRDAAREHGEVADLLELLARCKSIKAQSTEDGEHLQAALDAAAFVSYERTAR